MVSWCLTNYDSYPTSFVPGIFSSVMLSWWSLNWINGCSLNLWQLWSSSGSYVLLKACIFPSCIACTEIYHVLQSPSYILHVYWWVWICQGWRMKRVVTLISTVIPIKVDNPKCLKDISIMKREHYISSVVVLSIHFFQSGLWSQHSKLLSK